MLLEQRKLEEEEKKRSDEEKRQREEERMQKEREQREREEKRLKVEETRRQEQLSMTKAAPWSQANSTLGTSLAEIQKAEKERKAQEAIIQAQKAQVNDKSSLVKKVTIIKINRKESYNCSSNSYKKNQVAFNWVGRKKRWNLGKSSRWPKFKQKNRRD